MRRSCLRAVAPARAAACAMLACSLPAAGQLRVVTYNVAELNGDLDALAEVFAALNDDDKPGFAVAPHLYVFQEVDDADVDVLESMLDDAAPPAVNYVAGTYTNFDEQPGAQAMFFRDDTLVEIIGGHEDISTGASRFADRWKLQLVGDNSDDGTLYIYSAHLKASQGQSNQEQRHDGVVAIRADADDLPDGTQIIYAGDFNIYHNGEPAYEAFLCACPSNDPDQRCEPSPPGAGCGAGQAFDPLGPGGWAGESNALKHSQSPRLESNGALVGGGMDDRFDMMLVTPELLDAEGLRIIPGSYRSLGNDGQHYNEAINDGNNFYYPGEVARSNALADALHEASDHIPVVVDLELPDPDPPACEGDVTNDDVVDVEDLVFVVLSWGACDGCNADLDGNGVVDVEDLVMVILSWGPCT